MNRSTPLVLTIDDDNLINQILEKRISEMGYIAKTFAEPQEFLGAVKSLRPDLCVIDINFGDKSIGFLLVQAIRSTLDYYVPIVMLSGDSNIDSIAYAMELGADDYVVKPPQKESFEVTLHKFLKHESEVLNAPEIHRVVPNDRKKSKVIVDIKITHIADEGLYISCPSLITIGVPIRLCGDFVNEVFGEQCILVVVTRNWLDRETNEFGACVQFFEATKKLEVSARKYVEGVSGL